jgi:Ino eighty subunit 1
MLADVFAVFPEMRAQLRTYHPIPALQAHQDSSTYKQLQDAPRLKSILKGATEDTRQPSTIEDIRNAPKPRTNAVNLIFVMHQYFPKVTELHFQDDQDFFDLIMGTNMGSETRARAFLWLMWWYLESDFSYEDSQRNPFGPGLVSEADRNTDPLQVKVPTIAMLTEEQEEAENVDPPAELKFGEDKRKERIGILASEPSPAMIALKRARKEKGHSSTPGLSHGDDAGSDAGWAEYPSGKAHRKCPARTQPKVLYMRC